MDLPQKSVNVRLLFLGWRGRRFECDPILRRKCDMPEMRRRLNKLDTDLSFIPGHRTQIRHLAIHFDFGCAVPDPELLAFFDLMSQPNESPVGIYNHGMGFFLE